MVPIIKPINQPHSTVMIKLGSELFECRVWPWTDVVTTAVGLEDIVELNLEFSDKDKMAIVVLLSDLSLHDIEYIDDYDFMKVYNEIVRITNQGGH